MVIISVLACGKNENEFPVRTVRTARETASNPGKIEFIFEDQGGCTTDGWDIVLDAKKHLVTPHGNHPGLHRLYRAASGQVVIITDAHMHFGMKGWDDVVRRAIESEPGTPWTCCCRGWWDASGKKLNNNNHYYGGVFIARDKGGYAPMRSYRPNTLPNCRPTCFYGAFQAMTRETYERIGGETPHLMGRYGAYLQHWGWRALAVDAQPKILRYPNGDALEVHHFFKKQFGFEVPSFEYQISVWGWGLADCDKWNLLVNHLPPVSAAAREWFQEHEAEYAAHKAALDARRVWTDAEIIDRFVNPVLPVGNRYVTFRDFRNAVKLPPRMVEWGLLKSDPGRKIHARPPIHGPRHDPENAARGVSLHGMGDGAVRSRVRPTDPRPGRQGLPLAALETGECPQPVEGGGRGPSGEGGQGVQATPGAANPVSAGSECVGHDAAGNAGVPRGQRPKDSRHAPRPRREPDAAAHAAAPASRDDRRRHVQVPRRVSQGMGRGRQEKEGDAEVPERHGPTTP